MAFEITFAEALPILKVTQTQLEFLVARGDLKAFLIRNAKGKVVRRFLHHEDVVALAKTLERPLLIPRTPAQWRALRLKLLEEETLLGPSQAAKLMGTTCATVQRLAVEGQLPTAQLTRAGKPRFRRADVTALMKELLSSAGFTPAWGPLSPDDELISVEKASKLLRVSANLILELMKDGTLAVARVTPSGRRSLRRRDVVELVGTPVLERRSRHGPVGGNTSFRSREEEAWHSRSPCRRRSRSSK